VIRRATLAIKKRRKHSITRQYGAKQKDKYKYK
jgi:hypothetical protein